MKTEVDFYKLTRQFLLNETREPDDIFTFIQGLSDALSKFTPKTMHEQRRLQLSKRQLKEIKKYARKMQNELVLLEEKLNILEENKED